MNLTEAKAKFPVGSMVRIRYNGGHYSGYEKWAKKYMNREDFDKWFHNTKSYPEVGDVGMVIAVAPHSSTREFDIIVAVNVEDKKPFMMSAEDIEPYDPPFDGAVIPKAEIPQEEPVLDTGLTTFQSSSGYKVSFSGTNLIVTAHGETVSYNVEELLDEIADKCYQKSREIHLGDTVKIVDGEDTYPCFVEWLKQNLTFEQALMFDWEHTPKNGDNATVILIAPHQVLDKDLYLIEVEHDDVSRLYLVNREAIKKI